MSSRSSSGREEIEVKLPCSDLDSVRKNLQEAGAQPVSALHFERNDLYDNPQGQLATAGATLRLRRAQEETILTFKGPARFEQGLKRRQERETRVADAEEMEAILAGIGLARRFRYEKRREEWKLDDCIIALDETPIGTFVEIEGDPIQIRRLVVLLSLDFASAITYSYARLYKKRREEEPDLPEDMVFEEEAGR